MFNLLTIPLDPGLFGNIAHHRVQFLHYIVIRDSKDSVALIDKILRSCRIRKEIVFVTSPIQFNNELQLSAAEINNELINGFLPPKLQNRRDGDHEGRTKAVAPAASHSAASRGYDRGS